MPFYDSILSLESYKSGTYGLSDQANYNLSALASYR
jgi:hypothetical protein